MMLRAAGAGLGVPVNFRNLREEPILAGKLLRFEAGIPAGRYLIIDIGGGSTDLAVLAVGGPGKPTEVLDCTGERFLGGDDIDGELRRIVLDRCGLTEGDLDAAASYELGRDIENAKRQVTATHPELIPASIIVLGRATHVTMADLDEAWTTSGFERRLDRLVQLIFPSVIRRFGLRPEFMPLGAMPLYEQLHVWEDNAGVIGPNAEKLGWDIHLAHIDGIVPVGGGTRLVQFERWMMRTLLRPRAGGGMLSVIGQSSLGDPVEAVARGAAAAVDVKGLSLFRLPYAVFIQDKQGEPVTLMDPFERERPQSGTRYFDDQTELGIVDFTGQQPPAMHTLAAGHVAWRFDSLSTLHITNADRLDVELRLPWLEGELLKPVDNIKKRRQLEEAARFDRLGSPTPYLDQF